MGDPLGIGPEVIVKALHNPDLRRAARYVICGLHGPLEAAAAAAGIEPFWWRARRDQAEATRTHDVVILEDAASLKLAESLGRPGDSSGRAAGELSFRWVNDGISRCLTRDDDALHADALVTGPISKEAWSRAGHGRFPGHTELLASRCRAKRVGMMFHADLTPLVHPPKAPALQVILATAHIPLMTLRDALTIGAVFDAIELGHRACVELGIAEPRVAVCGLNPHAGENGLLGDEDGRIIAPAIRMAAEQGILATGPWPADTIFNAALAGKHDLVVAMYHDQGLIPVKLLARDHAVNFTVGLPLIRTSPDHGTAFDIAGKNRADAGSTRAAIRLALRLIAARAKHG